MPITNEFAICAVEKLFVERDTRQRQDIYTPDGEFDNSDGFLDSVRERGIFHPLLIERSGKVVFGERRLIAAKLCGHLAVPVRYCDDMTPLELRAIELEENLRRKGLNWRDEALAVQGLHRALQEANPSVKWGQVHTAEVIGMSTSAVSERLKVAENLDDEKLTDVKGLKEAHKIVLRQDEKHESEIEQSIGAAAKEIVTPKVSLTPEPSVAPSEEPTPAESVICVDFAEWAKSYSGPKFNFVHFALAPDHRPMTKIISTLRENFDRLIAPSSHLMIWVPPAFNLHQSVRLWLSEIMPSFMQWEIPLVWHKTDSQDLAYETAIVATREERELLRPDVANCYGAPQDRKWGPEAKPEPMLRHFFQMFCNEHTKMLDPACKNASALRAAESLGAELVVGIESDAEMVMEANGAMKVFRALRKVT